jgi:hypothetical protein
VNPPFNIVAPLVPSVMLIPSKDPKSAFAGFGKKPSNVLALGRFGDVAAPHFEQNFQPEPF